MNSSVRISPGVIGSSRLLIVQSPASVIVCYLYFVSVTIFPPETKTVLIIDSDTVLSSPVASEHLQSITFEHG